MEDVSVIKKAAEMNAEHLLTHFDRIADAPDAIPRLRRFILDLAVRGKLVPQDPNDEPASRIAETDCGGKSAAGEARGDKEVQASADCIRRSVELPFNVGYGRVFEVTSDRQRNEGYR